MDKNISLADTTGLTAFCRMSLESSKALDIAAIDLNGNSSITDVMMVASGTSSRHVCAIAERLEEHLNRAGLDDITLSGINEGRWVIADLGDVMVHVLLEEERARYHLEDLYKVMAAGAEITQ